MTERIPFESLNVSVAATQNSSMNISVCGCASEYTILNLTFQPTFVNGNGNETFL